jgi:phosphopantothenoylcysteine synthetase/decarboxylase
VLLGVTGSVAAIKVPELATQLRRFADVRIVATPSAQHFFTEEQLPAECRPLLGASLQCLQLSAVQCV